MRRELDASLLVGTYSDTIFFGRVLSCLRDAYDIPASPNKDRHQDGHQVEHQMVVKREWVGIFNGPREHDCKERGTRSLCQGASGHINAV